MTLDDVARVTKIQPRILERLEAGKLEGLPAEVFVRGFVRSVARCVGLDEREALRRHAACGAGCAMSALGPTSRALVDAMTDLTPSSGTARATPRKMLAVDDVEVPASVAEGAAPAARVNGASPVRHGESSVALAPSGESLTVLGTTGESSMAPACNELSTSARIEDSSMALGDTGASSTAPGHTGESSTVSVPASASSVTPGGHGNWLMAPNAAGESSLLGASPGSSTVASISSSGDRMRAAVADLAVPVGALDSEALIPVDPELAHASSSVRDSLEVPPVAAPGSAKKKKGRRAKGRNKRRALAAGTPAEASPVVNAPAAAPWTQRMSAPWRRPSRATSPSALVPRLVIDDADPDSAELVLEERAEKQAPRRSLLPPILLDREDRSARQGGLTLAVIILLIAATLTLSYLMRRPSASGDGMTLRGQHSACASDLG